MAEPTRFSPAYDFSDFQTSNPGDPLPGDKVDIELAALEITTDEIIDNLGLIQRDDGKLANLSVSPDSLDSAARALIVAGGNPSGDWATATAYAVGDIVDNISVYICLVAHTSGTFATDLAAGKWMLLSYANALSETAYFERFSGTGSSQNITLSQEFGTDEKEVEVYVDGLRLDPTGGYTLSGTTLSGTFANGTNNILVFAPDASAAQAAIDAATSAAAAATSETNAGTSETNAASSASTASTAATAAQTAQTAAELAETNAETAETGAVAARTAAETAETNAETAETGAVAAQAAAETAETNAETAETGAVAARDKAQDWAEEVEDTPVETGQFSALHHAAKASASASAASSSATTASNAATAAQTAQTAAELAETNAETAETAAEAAQAGAEAAAAPGGTTGQVLSKASATDFDTAWADVESVMDLAGLTEEVTPGSTDLVLLELASTGAKRKVQITNLPGGGGGIASVADDATPQLGGDLDYNGNQIVDANGNEVLGFANVAAAVNFVQLTNAATTNGAIVEAEGGDANVDLVLRGKGTGAVAVTGDITVTGNVDGRDVAADGTKLDGIDSGANNYTHPNHTGDVTSTGDGATVIANDAVTNAKLANVATSTIKGRVTAATGDPEDLTAAQVRTLLNVANGAIANVSEDATPQLGGNLDLNGNQIIAAATGSAASPQLDFGDDGTGFFGASGVGVGCAVSGSQVWNAGSAQVVFNQPARVQDGSVSAPTFAFASDTNNGAYRIGVDNWAFSAGGVLAQEFTESAGVVTTEFPNGPVVARPEVVTAKTGSFTFALTEADRITPVNSAGAVNATVPPNSSVAFPVGTVLPLLQTGAGQVTWVAGAGVTLNVESTLTLLSKGQHAVSFALKTATDTWTVAGNLEAA